MADEKACQVLRYMGCVDKQVAQPQGKTVEGLIIAHQADKAALYALSTLTHVRFMTYEIHFSLNFSHGIQD